MFSVWLFFVCLSWAEIMWTENFNIWHIICSLNYSVFASLCLKTFVHIQCFPGKCFKLETVFCILNHHAAHQGPVFWNFGSRWKWSSLSNPLIQLLRSNTFILIFKNFAGSDLIHSDLLEWRFPDPPSPQNQRDEKKGAFHKMWVIFCCIMIFFFFFMQQFLIFWVFIMRMLWQKTNFTEFLLNQAGLIQRDTCFF